MQSFYWDNFTIEVTDATANYEDHLNEYQSVFFSTSRPISVVLIRLFEGEDLLKQIIIGAGGGATGVFKTSVLLDDNGLVCCCADSLFCVSIPDLNLLWNIQADMATCFQVFKWRKDYIVHGEVEISKIDKAGNIIWQHSGRDIFVTLDGTKDFELFEDYVEATDFIGYKYKFNFDGDSIA